VRSITDIDVLAFRCPLPVTNTTENGERRTEHKEGGVELVQSTEPRRRHDVTPRRMQRYGRGRRK
jgi:hypothetical protein